ncbi:unnamed protein product [Diamesa hyperborea]
MLSLPEQRNILVQQLVPKLIKNLTGFKENDKNFNICLEFSWSLIKHHRFLSVNSHEIKREMEGIFEKFRFNNFHDEEKIFRKLYEELINHEICTEHYEKDVIFSILSLLTNLSNSPLHIIKVKLRKNQEIFLKPQQPHDLDKELIEMKSQLLEELVKNNITLEEDDNSDLSDWSDNDSDTSCQVVQELKAPLEQVPINEKSPSITFKEPQKPVNYYNFESPDPEGWLKRNLQHSWWNEAGYNSEVTSFHPGASFSQQWQNHLTKKSLGFIKIAPQSTISEYCLIREILWMFSDPVDCKCFKIHNNEYILREDPPVTIPSITANTLQVFLQDFLKRINIMNKLQQDCEQYQMSSTISHTYESYIGEIQNYLYQIMDFVVSEEAIVKSQNETYTVLTLHDKFKDNFELLDMLWDIHSDSLLDSNEHPSHICSSYLLASLHSHIIYNGFKKKKNLAIALYLKTLKPYLMIVDSWWTENYRLEDYKDEFLVQNLPDNSHEIVERLLVKNKAKSFYVSTVISNRITKDSIIQMILFYSLKAGYTLNIIARLDMIEGIKKLNNKDPNSTLYGDFMEIVMKEVQSFAVIQENKKELEEIVENKSEDKKKISNSILEDILDEGDELLMLAFQSTFDLINEQTDSNDKSTATVNYMEMYDQLNQASDWLLPIENSISKTIEHLLRQKISIAERFVMRIYRNEFQVEKHLQELRNVFFLESNELMRFFYTTLFPDMESGESVWSNPFLLTLSMNQVLSCQSSTNMSTLFRVEIGKSKRNVFSVMDAIDDLIIHYNVENNLSNVVTPKCIQQYNKVFKFLLKIKYGLWIMNELRFPEFFKKRPPYAKLQLIDVVIKRLALARFWIQYCINSCHNHFMMSLQSLSKELDARVKKAENISEFINCHEAFINTSYEYTLQTRENKDIFELIIQMLKLAGVLKNEWSNVITDYDLDQQGKIESSHSLQEMNASANKIESSYIMFHAKLKLLLNDDRKSYLSALNDALDSIPYCSQ